VCRALLVLCVAPDPDALALLKRAVVAAEWELAPGAVTEQEALAQLEGDRAPDVLVTLGPFAGLVERARALRPGLRIVSIGPMPGADAEVRSLDEARRAVLSPGRSGGPVRT
jgi:hypothetical protein